MRFDKADISRGCHFPLRLALITCVQFGIAGGNPSAMQNEVS